MQIDKEKFVDIIQARKEFKELQGTSDNKRKVISSFKKKVLKFIQELNIEYHYIPHDSNTSTPAKLYIPKEYVKVFLHNKEARLNKIYKYEHLTINTTGKSFADTLKELGITYSCFQSRLHKGWSFASAITTPHKDLQETEYKNQIKRELDRFMIRKRKMKYRQF